MALYAVKTVAILARFCLDHSAGEETLTKFFPGSRDALDFEIDERLGTRMSSYVLIL